MKENSEIAVIIGAIAAVGIIVYFVYKYLVPKPSPTSTSYNCVNGSCVEVQGTGGQYSTLAECQSACVTTPQVSPIKLSASDTNINPGEIVTFTINGNYPNVYLYACSSQSSAESAVPDGNDFSGQLGQWFLSLKNGTATTQLKPSQIANDTYWVAVASDGTLSNIVEVTTKIVSPSSMTLSGSGSFNQMTFTIKSNSGSSFTAWLYIYNSRAAAENAPPDGGYSSGQLAQYTVSVNNGSGSTVLDPYLIISAAQYWVAVYENSSKAITRSNILTVAPSTSKTTSPPSNSSSTSSPQPSSSSTSVPVSAATYQIAFTESGLPTGSTLYWQVNVNGKTYRALVPNVINISLKEGTYTYEIPNVYYFGATSRGQTYAPSPRNGTVTAASVSKNIFNIAFHLITVSPPVSNTGAYGPPPNYEAVIQEINNAVGYPNGIVDIACLDSAGNVSGVNFGFTLTYSNQDLWDYVNDPSSYIASEKASINKRIQQILETAKIQGYQCSKYKLS